MHENLPRATTRALAQQGTDYSGWGNISLADLQTILHGHECVVLGTAVCVRRMFNL